MWATKSALTLGMHHCFFCHGLRAFFQVQAHRLVGQGLDHSQFNHPVRQQAQIPVVVALGAGLQARAIRWASPRSSSLRYRWGWVRSLSAPSNPSSAKRRLRRNTVPSDTSRAWATLDADQPSPVLSRMRARVVTWAGLFPARTKCSSWSRSSGVSRTANFSLTTTPPHSNTNCSKISTTSQLPMPPSKPRLTEY